jgi:predicted component of type VI protein secretion system
MVNYSISTHESKETHDSHLKLRLKLFGGPSTGEVFYFKPDNEVIKIGRSNNCDVAIEDAVLSKFQSSIKFNPEKECWVLEDGFNDKRSLNGTWLYLNDDYDIYNGMTFKAN